MTDPGEWQMARTLAWARAGGSVAVLLIFAAFVKVLFLKVEPDPRLESVVGIPESRLIEMESRGDLLDRRGRLLATSRRGYRLFVDPVVAEQKGDLATLAVELAQRIGGDPAGIDRLLQVAEGVRYVRIRHLLDDHALERIRSMPPLPGVGLEMRLVREVHHGGVGAALTGHVDHDHDGRSGAERRFNALLAPRHGDAIFLRDSKRRPLWVERDDYRPGAPGEPLRLSIDLVIQQIVEDRLQQALVERNAAGVRAVVLDTISGEILAMHDVIAPPRPGFTNPLEDPFRDIDPALGRNRCVTDQYEPGSTFKPFAWATATMHGLLELDVELPTPVHTGYRTGYGRLIRDDWYYGPSTWRKVLVKSMNSGMAIASERLSHRQLQDAVRAFGFGTLTRCGVPGEIPGYVQSARKWTNYTQSSVAMGHEIAVTPVQMVRAFSAFCRDDGRIVSLRMTAVEPGELDPPVARTAIDPGIARLTREVMRDVMLDGTGRPAESHLYRLFGKSGTAELVNPKGGYFRDRYTSSFIAGAPFEHPRLIVLVVVDDPDRSRGDYKGGRAAGPVVRDIMDASLRYLGVHPDKPAGVVVPRGGIASAVRH